MKKILFKTLSVLLAVTLLCSVLPMSIFAEITADSKTDEIVPGTETYVAPEYTYTPEEAEGEVEEEVRDDAEPPVYKNDIELAATGAWDGTSVYDPDDGVIYISNYNQLALIGTDTFVTDADTTSGSVGTGNQIVLSGSGTPDDPYVYLTYSADAVYYLTDDIPLPSKSAWSVPNGFTGKFTSEDADGEDNIVLHAADTRLYESIPRTTKDKVYFHNVFQMAESNVANIYDKDYDLMDYENGSFIAFHLYSTDNEYIKVLNHTLCYTVDQILTVRPHETEELRIQQGKDYVTLVTCTPYGVNSHRLLVRGVRTPFDDTQDIPVYEVVDMGSFWSRLPAQYRHMLYGAGAIVAFLIVYWIVILIRKSMKKRRVPENGEDHDTGEKTE